MFLFVCFFFKLKTAYEMRISDWSSDVCSSDLIGTPAIEVYRTLNIGGKIENESARIGLIDAVDAQNTYCTGAISTDAKFLCFLRQHCFGTVGGCSRGLEVADLSPTETRSVEVQDRINMKSFA